MTWAEAWRDALSAPVTEPWALAGLAALALLCLLLGVASARAGRAARLARDLSVRLDALAREHADKAGAQTQAVQAVDARLAAASAQIGDRLDGATARTAHALGDLQARLAAIDRAQANIEKLSGDVLGLQDILANKQTRGAFGEIQLHDLVQTVLPPNAYRWQATLPNGRRADCLIDLPDPPGPLAVDAKFPLEAYEALLKATTDHEKATAARAFRTALRSHITAIAEKYILPGHTADSAVMFLPSEAVYAELHANFGDVVRASFDARVWIVSPTTLMATLNTLRAILKDARLREQAAAIRSALRLLHQDIALIEKRAAKLQNHFGQAADDIDGLLSAATRAGGRAKKLEAVELESDDAPTTTDQGPAPNGVTIVRS